MAGGRVPGAVHIPMNDMPARIAELPRDTPFFVICAVGGRSRQVVDHLRAEGLSADQRGRRDRRLGPARLAARGLIQPPGSMRGRSPRRATRPTWASRATKNVRCAGDVQPQQVVVARGDEGQPADRDDEERGEQDALGPGREAALAGCELLRPRRQSGDPTPHHAGDSEARGWSGRGRVDLDEGVRVVEVALGLTAATTTSPARRRRVPGPGRDRSRRRP